MKYFSLEPQDVLRTTYLGVLVVILKREIWLPKSRIIMNVCSTGNLLMLIPEWICEKENL